MPADISGKTYSTLFLDRDGTINRRIMEGYVTSWSSFEFLPGVLEAIHHLSKAFEHMIVVTNQQAVGKEIMTREEVNEIHTRMVEEIENAHGRIDQIYVCPHLSIWNPLCRKPNPGMALQAKEDFPDIDFSESIMVGDTDSDILFGQRLNMFTVRIASKKEKAAVKADLTVKGLLEFHLFLQRQKTL